MAKKSQQEFVQHITPRSEDFSQWYTDVVRLADLMDYTPVRGCMAIKPYGYGIWELIQQQLDAEFKRTGHQNVSMPMLIPESLLLKEADHVEGFAPEVAWVTQGGTEPLAERLAQGMATLGMPVTLGDLQAHRARRPGPLTLQHQQGTLWNLAPPTQGLVSLAILGITDRLKMADADDAQTVHRIVEATKRAFALRDAHITDPRHLDVDVQQLLTPEALQPLADSIDDASASPWGGGKGPGDTVWMGVVDNSGLAVSFIQSIYHEFGSGVVLPDTGIVWQNRGAAFSLDPQHLLALAPGKQPFHTLNPAAARLNDGRVMVYGSMGGDGQPQTQAALFTRYILQGVPLQESISRPRWLLGRTWGQSSDSLKLEGRFAPACIARLRELGHDVEVLADFSEAMGHAGAIVRHPNGLLEGATDPRSNGAAAGY